MKQTKNTIIGLTILVCIILAFMFTCTDGINKGKTVTIKPIIDKQINDKAKTIIQTKLRIDTIEIVKTKIVTKYKTIYDTIIKQAPDTCKGYLIALDKACDSKDSVNNSQLFQYSNLVRSQSDLIAIQKFKLQSDSIDMINLNDELKFTQKQVKRGKIKTVLTSIVSGLAGFGLGSLAR